MHSVKIKRAQNTKAALAPYFLLPLAAFLIISSSLCLSSKVSAGQVYKYRDNDGIIQYDHRPPEDKQYETIEPPSTTHPDQTTQPSAPNDTKINTDNTPYSSQLDQLEDERMAACENARKNKHILLSTIRVSIKQINGTEKLLTKSEKLEKIKNMDDAIKDYCPTVETP